MSHLSVATRDGQQTGSASPAETQEVVQGKLLSNDRVSLGRVHWQRGGYYEVQRIHPDGCVTVWLPDHTKPFGKLLLPQEFRWTSRYLN